MLNSLGNKDGPGIPIRSPSHRALPLPQDLVDSIPSGWWQSTLQIVTSMEIHCLVLFFGWWVEIFFTFPPISMVQFPGNCLGDFPLNHDLPGERVRLRNFSGWWVDGTAIHWVEQVEPWNWDADFWWRKIRPRVNERPEGPKMMGLEKVYNSGFKYGHFLVSMLNFWGVPFFVHPIFSKVGFQ